MSPSGGPWALLVKSPLSALFLAAALTGCLGYAALGLETRFEIEDFFPRETPARVAYERTQALFGRDDRAGLLLIQAPARLGPTDFARVHALTARVASLSMVEEVLSPSHVALPTRSPSGEVGLSPALPPNLPPGGPSLAEVERLHRELSQPPYEGLLSGEVCLVAAILDETRMGYDDRSDLKAALEEEAQALRSAGYEVWLAGYPIQRLVLERLITSESRRLLPWTLVLIVVLGAISFRSLAGAILPLLVAGGAAIWTTGLMAIFGLQPNVFAAAVFVVVAVVGVADGVHLLARARELRAGGLDRAAAAQGALRQVGPACCYASLTTGIAFASLALSDLPLIADMGIQVALGVAAALVLSLLLFPAAALWGTRTSASSQAEGPLSRGLSALDGWAAARPRTIALGFLAVAIVAAWSASHLESNAPLLADLEPEHPLRQANRLVEERLGGAIPLEILLEPTPGEFPYETARMARIEALTIELRTLPGVASVSGPVDPLRRLAPLLETAPVGSSSGHHVADDEVPGLLPSALLLAEEQIKPWVAAEADVMRIRLRVRDVDTKTALALFAQIEERYRATLGEDPTGKLTGQGYLAQTVNAAIVNHFARGFVIALIAVALVLLIAFRDPALALASLLPNLFPVLCLAGLMPLLGIELRYTTALVLSIVFGIAVDDTIHLLAQRGRQAGKNALSETIRVAGPGLVLTSILLGGGFGVLLLADFLPLRVVGLTLGITAGLALAADLLLLPALLRLFGRG
ncbi:MAG: MMPL family transporter [Planctomycetes bacterium]|nr:MMPL family transporter [Planctomycetota bacterium]